MSALAQIGAEDRTASIGPMFEVHTNWTATEPAVLNFARKPPERAIRNRYRTTRRLFGILLWIDGKEVRVLFETKEGPVEYDLPFKPFKDACVTVTNQPFEYSEVEVTFEDGRTEIIPEVLAMAPRSSATVKSLPLNPDLRAKRTQVLSYFSKQT